MKGYWFKDHRNLGAVWFLHCSGGAIWAKKPTVDFVCA